LVAVAIRFGRSKTISSTRFRLTSLSLPHRNHTG
jgi:hypothetical protein